MSVSTRLTMTALLAAGALAPSVLTACVEDWGAATCADGLWIVVEDSSSAAVDTMSGKLIFDGDRVVEFSCADGTGTATSDEVRCSASGIYVAGVSAAAIQLAITSPAGEFSGAVDPRYQAMRPNGEACDPVCRMANERVVVVPAAP